MVNLSENAAKEVKRLMLQQNQPSLALRFGVKGGGCSGMTYFMNIEKDEPREVDDVIEQDGVKILVDKKSHLYVHGMTIDYESSLTGGGFKFENPNAKGSCGCGTSFTV